MFDELKKWFTTAPVLQHHNPEKPSQLETNVSMYAYSAILSQRAEDNKIHRVVFLSKSMTPAERKYDIYDKDMLAMVKSLKFWRHYLEGAKFPVKILTDHKNLEYFKKSQHLNK